MGEEISKPKDQLLSVRLSSEEMTILRHRADGQGLRLSDYARQVLLKTKPPRSRLKVAASTRGELIRLLGRLGSIGSDINQLSAVAVATGSTPQQAILEQSHEALLALLEELREIF